MKNFDKINAIKELLKDAIAEMNGYIDDEDNGYDDLERHDCRIACEAYERILNCIERM